MRVFAFEYFSGGGLAGCPLPASLAREGDLMLSTLVRDLAELPGITVVVSRDPRLPPLPDCVTIVPEPGEDVFALYARGLTLAQAAWPTAPEGAAVLERLSRASEAAGRVLLGCRPEAVRLAGSKHATSRALGNHGIPVVPTYAFGETPAPIPGPWVLKPDDGAGCEDTEILADRARALDRLAGHSRRLVIQPWIEGEPISLSLLCRDGTARVLACNRQRITIRGGQVSLDAVLVNAVPDAGGRFTRLAQRIAAAVPGLWGYVGVDLVLSREGPVVLEINPRLTTSYCGLRRALALNPAALVLGLLQGGHPPELPGPGPGTTAEVSLESSCAG